MVYRQCCVTRYYQHLFKAHYILNFIFFPFFFIDFSQIYLLLCVMIVDQWLYYFDKQWLVIFRLFMVHNYNNKITKKWDILFLYLHSLFIFIDFNGTIDAYNYHKSKCLYYIFSALCFHLFQHHKCPLRPSFSIPTTSICRFNFPMSFLP